MSEVEVVIDEEEEEATSTQQSDTPKSNKRPAVSTIWRLFRVLCKCRAGSTAAQAAQPARWHIKSGALGCPEKSTKVCTRGKAFSISQTF